MWQISKLNPDRSGDEVDTITYSREFCLSMTQTVNRNHCSFIHLQPHTHTSLQCVMLMWRLCRFRLYLGVLSKLYQIKVQDRREMLCKIDTKKINIPFPFGSQLKYQDRGERVLRCARTCFIKNSSEKYSEDMNSSNVINTKYFKTLKIFCQIDTTKIFLLNSSPVPHFSLPTKLRTTNFGDTPLRFV